jgi:hypothetical protein
VSESELQTNIDAALTAGLIWLEELGAEADLLKA